MSRAATRSTRRTKPRVSNKPPTRPRGAGKLLIVNRDQLAALLGVHQDTITEYARNGMPMLARGGYGREGAYDAVDCVAWWRSKQGKNAKENAQTRAFTVSAELNELKLAQQRSELVSSTEVIAAGQAFTKGWTAMVRALPRQAVQAGVIEREREPQLLALVRPILQEIAGWRVVAQIADAVTDQGRSAHAAMTLVASNDSTFRSEHP